MNVSLVRPAKRSMIHDDCHPCGSPPLDDGDHGIRMHGQKICLPVMLKTLFVVFDTIQMMLLPRFMVTHALLVTACRRTGQPHRKGPEASHGEKLKHSQGGMHLSFRLFILG
jgi:hypothetical protein